MSNLRTHATTTFSTLAKDEIRTDDPLGECLYTAFFSCWIAVENSRVAGVGCSGGNGCRRRNDRQARYYPIDLVTNR